MTWRVVPLSGGQLLDVNPADILQGGLYRKCDTYKGGGGYDQFPDICEKRLGVRTHKQFVVQLYGCNLDCPYCYVTREGVWGKFERVSTTELVDAFIQSGQEVFHLMGGAPALQISQWPSLIQELFARCPDAIFHSDLMLTEGQYGLKTLFNINHPRALYAVNIKGTTPAQWFALTRKPLDEELFWKNFERLSCIASNVYVTFTGVTPDAVEEFWRRSTFFAIPKVLSEDSFIIDLIDYKASSHVDDTGWGGTK